MAGSIWGQILTVVNFASNVMCSAKLSDGTMDQAPCISEAAQIYIPMVNLVQYEKFYF